MLQRIEAAAELSVARGCGFGLLAILTMMVGFSADLHLAFRAGGFMTLMMCMVLLLCAWHAPRKPYKSTETWLMLPQEVRPHPDIAQQIISNVMQTTFYRFAIHSAWLAIGFLGCSLFIKPTPMIVG